MAKNRVKCIQFNMNHSSGAQDMSLQYMLENDINLGCFSEAWLVPENNPYWFLCNSKRAAIFCNNVRTRRMYKLVASSGDWVCIELGDIYIISCYLSPNEGIARFKEGLVEMGRLVRNHPNKVLLCGDFNARSVSWGCN